MPSFARSFIPRCIASANEETSSFVACSGGDGSINGVIAGMVARNDRIPIGYIPTGTVNDFASSLRIPKQIMKAAHQIVEGYPFPCDVGRFNDKNFVYVAAFGLFTDVSYETNQGLKNIFGQAAYIMEGVKRISKLTKYHVKVTCDEQIIEDDFVVGMVTNSKSVGGFRSLIGSKVYFDDGQFEVTLIKYPRNLNEMRLIVNSLLSGKLDPEHIYQLRASRIVFESWDDISWTRDGEYGGTFQKVEIENLQQAVRIMVNEEHLKAVASDKTQGRRLD